MEINEALQNDPSPSRATVYCWIRQFKDGMNELEDDPRERRQSTLKMLKTLSLSGIMLRNINEQQ